MKRVDMQIYNFEPFISTLALQCTEIHRWYIFLYCNESIYKKRKEMY